MNTRMADLDSQPSRPIGNGSGNGAEPRGCLVCDLPTRGRSAYCSDAHRVQAHRLRNRQQLAFRSDALQAELHRRRLTAFTVYVCETAASATSACSDANSAIASAGWPASAGAVRAATSRCSSPNCSAGSGRRSHDHPPTRPLPGLGRLGHPLPRSPTSAVLFSVSTVSIGLTSSAVHDPEVVTKSPVHDWGNGRETSR